MSIRVPQRADREVQDAIESVGGVGQADQAGCAKLVADSSVNVCAFVGQQNTIWFPLLWHARHLLQ